VTHKPSGLALGKFSSKRKAKQMADHMHAHAGDAGGDAKFGKRPSKAANAAMRDAYMAFDKSDADTPDLVKGGGPYIGKRGGKWADPQHKIPWKDAKHAGKPEPKEKAHDEHGARELELHIDNTEHLANETKRTAYGEHQTQRGAIHANLAKKIAAGKYDHAQAGKLFQHHVDAASKHYSKEYGAPAGGGHHFDAATRRHVAREMADQFHEEVKDGEHDHHVESGVHAKRAKAGGGLSSMAEAHEGHKTVTHSDGSKTTLRATRGPSGHVSVSMVGSGGATLPTSHSRTKDAPQALSEAAAHVERSRIGDTELKGRESLAAAKEHKKLAEKHAKLSQRTGDPTAPAHGEASTFHSLAAATHRVEAQQAGASLRIGSHERKMVAGQRGSTAAAQSKRAHAASAALKEHPQLVRSMPADNSLMGYSDEIMNFYSQG
jgi:hypothetical protein